MINFGCSGETAIQPCGPNACMGPFPSYMLVGEQGMCAAYESSCLGIRGGGKVIPSG